MVSAEKRRHGAAPAQRRHSGSGEFRYPRPLRPPANNHIAFGSGPHRCLGSHLVRRELRVALEEWHRTIPEYRLTEGVEVTGHGGGFYGIDQLELSWDVWADLTGHPVRLG